MSSAGQLVRWSDGQMASGLHWTPSAGLFLLFEFMKTVTQSVTRTADLLEFEIMPNKAQEDAVINLKTLQEMSRQLGFEWTVLAYELGFNRTEVGRFHTKSVERSVQARTMLESWYEKSWDKPNKTKLLQDGLERAGRRDLAERLRCLHWGHQKLSRRVELPSAFPFLITVHKTIHNQDALRRINDLNRRFT